MKNIAKRAGNQSERPKSVVMKRMEAQTIPRSQSALDFHHDPPSSSPSLSDLKSLKDSKVRVAVRVRPYLERELQINAQCLIEMDTVGQSTIILPPNSGKIAQTRRNLEPKEFFFDKCFWSLDESRQYADQNTVYQDIGKEFLDHNIEGYHTCIFAYVSKCAHFFCSLA